MKIQNNFDFSHWTSFRVPAICDYFCEIDTIDELDQIIDFSLTKNIPLLAMGGGSNLLFTKQFPGIIIKINLKGISFTDINEDEVLVSAYAGENWNHLVDVCTDLGYGGIENLTLIPGNVGAAPVQNIGAYGKELKDIFHSLKAIDIHTKKIKIFNKEECRFGYRDSIFKQEKGKYIIIEVNLTLRKRDYKIDINYGIINKELEKEQIKNPNLLDIKNCINSIRRSKLPDPQIIGNAGSFFKNPIINKNQWENLIKQFPKMPYYHLLEDEFKIPAAWLIESCGWKGKKSINGSCGVYEKQALILVNYGNANGIDIYRLSEEIIMTIKNKFNIELEREVNVI